MPAIGGKVQRRGGQHLFLIHSTEQQTRGRACFPMLMPSRPAHLQPAASRARSPMLPWGNARPAFLSVGVGERQAHLSWFHDLGARYFAFLQVARSQEGGHLSLDHATALKLNVRTSSSMLIPSGLAHLQNLKPRPALLCFLGDMQSHVSS